MPYLFCELDEMTSLYHDVPWKVLTYDNMTSPKSFGLLKYRRPVLHYINLPHCTAVTASIVPTFKYPFTVSFSNVTMMGLTPLASSSGDLTTLRNGMSRDIASWDLIT